VPPRGVLVRCAAVADVLAAGTPAPAEAERRSAFASPAAARAFVAGRDLARALAAELAGVPVPDVVLLGECPRCGAGGHGRPTARYRDASATFGAGAELASLSVSRSAGWVAVAAGAPGVRLGLDLVDLDAPAFDADRPGHVGPAREWARAEALGKLAGTGLFGEGAAEEPGGVGHDGAVASWEGWGRPPGTGRRSALRVYLAAG